MNKNIDVPRDELDRILDQFRKGKNSNFGLGEIYGQLHEVCEMQTALHQAHYNIDKVVKFHHRALNNSSRKIQLQHR